MLKDGLYCVNVLWWQKVCIGITKSVKVWSSVKHNYCVSSVSQCEEGNCCNKTEMFTEDANSSYYWKCDEQSRCKLMIVLQSSAKLLLCYFCKFNYFCFHVMFSLKITNFFTQTRLKCSKNTLNFISEPSEQT